MAFDTHLLAQAGRAAGIEISGADRAFAAWIWKLSGYD